MRLDKRKIIYSLIIFILILMIFFFLIKAQKNYSTWKSYHEYFHHSEIRIESWMTLKMIQDHFGVSTKQIFNEMGVDEKKVNCHTTLQLLCKEYDQDCINLTERLNHLELK